MKGSMVDWIGFLNVYVKFVTQNTNMKSTWLLRSYLSCHLLRRSYTCTLWKPVTVSRRPCKSLDFSCNYVVSILQKSILKLLTCRGMLMRKCWCPLDWWRSAWRSGCDPRRSARIASSCPSSTAWCSCRLKMYRNHVRVELCYDNTVTYMLLCLEVTMTIYPLLLSLLYAKVIPGCWPIFEFTSTCNSKNRPTIRTKFSP